MKRWLSVAAVALALLGGADVRAEASNDAQAKTLFDLGAKAYESQQYLAAAAAFQQAYKLVPRDGIIFSIAQAYRRQFYTDSKSEHLRFAVARYREYLEKAPNGNRSADSRQALAELEPVLAKLGVDAAAPPIGETPKAETRLMVSVKGAKQAQISVDGGPLQKMPLIAEVKPGDYKLRVVADGYFDEELPVTVLEGDTRALDVPLREKPALVEIAADDGAEVLVDGRSLGETPLPGPVEVKAGAHVVSVGRNGYEGYSDELLLKRGEKRPLPVELEPTAQRYASYVVFATAIGAVAAGGVFTGLAVAAENDALDIDERRMTTGIQGEEGVVDDYNSALDRRNGFRVGAFAGFGAGALLGVVGALLFGVDQPSYETPRRSLVPEGEQPAEEPGEPSTNVEFGAVPAWVPGGAMGYATVRF